MNLRNVDLNLLTVFDAVIRDGNLTRAAERIGMSQPAMSAALGRLRLLFGDELFTRTGHGMKPTPRALQFAGPVRQILDLVVMTLPETSRFDFCPSTRSFHNPGSGACGAPSRLAPVVAMVGRYDGFGHVQHPGCAA